MPSLMRIVLPVCLSVSVLGKSNAATKAIKEVAKIHKRLGLPAEVTGVSVAPKEFAKELTVSCSICHVVTLTVEERWEESHKSKRPKLNELKEAALKMCVQRGQQVVGSMRVLQTSDQLHHICDLFCDALVPGMQEDTSNGKNISQFCRAASACTADMDGPLRTQLLAAKAEYDRVQNATVGKPGKGRDKKRKDIASEEDALQKIKKMKKDGLDVQMVSQGDIKLGNVAKVLDGNDKARRKKAHAARDEEPDYDEDVEQGDTHTEL